MTARAWECEGCGARITDPWAIDETQTVAVCSERCADGVNDEILR